MKFVLITYAFLAYAPMAWSQCAPGIPGAGNPGCIPPTAPGSPYGQTPASGELPPAAAPPVWEDRWGAVAMDYKASASGSVSDSPTEERASRAALLDCEGQGGTHCEVVLTYYNQCAAITQSAKGIFSSATAATKSRAESRVMAKCGDERTCRILYSQCALPVRVQ
ncbi:protein of unknown function [Dyella sp. 333MFSha]|nr:protein of unknown function [Dyella sp. 333MFSha]